MYEDFEKLCEERGVRVSEVAKATGISPTTFSEWKKGKYTPKMDKMTRIAEYFDVPVDQISGIRGNYIFTVKKRTATPLYEASAGQGRVNGQYATDYMDDTEADEEHSWCTICGDSMLPELKDGDKVRVHHQTETTPQDLTVVKVDGESCTVKYVEITDNGVWLRALNKSVYEDRFYTIREVMQLPIKVVGKVVEVRREY